MIGLLSQQTREKFCSLRDVLIAHLMKMTAISPAEEKAIKVHKQNVIFFIITSHTHTHLHTSGTA
jgi:hypothetical protein